jgi:hypothetical protein
MKRFVLSATVLVFPLLASAQLAFTVSAVKISGQKAVAHLALKNDFGDRVESARAVVFLLDDQGHVVGQATKWVIGGEKGYPPLAPGATNSFNFVVQGDKPFTTTNLTAKVSFTRILLEGGKSADLSKEVQVRNSVK